MSSRVASSKQKASAKSHERPSKKAKFAQNLPAKPTRKGTPPPPKKREDAPTVFSASAKGKGKAVVDTTDSVTNATKKKGKAKADPEDVPLPNTFKVIAGSYEKLLYGLEGTISVEDSKLEYHLKPIFIFPAHVSSLKAVAASPKGGKWLATGSADEIIKVWDLRRKKEIGGLMHHEGSITHLEFASRSHLLSASEDGTLCLFRARDWAVLRNLKGHKGRVNSVAVHPSGKIALSVGKDRTLRMWDLMRGKGAASTKIYKEGELVRWSTDGSLFAVQTQSTIDIYATDMTLLHTVTHPARIQDIKFVKSVNGNSDLLLVSAEDKKVTIYDIHSDAEKSPTIIATLIGHTNRVKAVDTLQIALPSVPGSERTSTTIAATISSDGTVHIYDLASIPTTSSPNEQPQIEPVTVYDTKGSRLTCLALADGDMGGEKIDVGKRKREEESDEEEEGDSDIEIEEDEEEDEEEEED